MTRVTHGDAAAQSQGHAHRDQLAYPQGGGELATVNPPMWTCPGAAFVAVDALPSDLCGWCATRTPEPAICGIEYTNERGARFNRPACRECYVLHLPWLLDSEHGPVTVTYAQALGSLAELGRPRLIVLPGGAL